MFVTFSIKRKETHLTLVVIWHGEDVMITSKSTDECVGLCLNSSADWIIGLNYTPLRNRNRLLQQR